MAWIEHSDQNILLVRQAAGLKLWTLPGGKAKPSRSTRKNNSLGCTSPHPLLTQLNLLVSARGQIQALQAGATADERARLMKLTQRYCAVYQALRRDSRMSMIVEAAGKPTQ